MNSILKKLGIVDERGDSGFSLKYSKYLILILVLFKSKKAAAITDKAISDLKKRTGRINEFKFSKCRRLPITRFFSSVTPRNFEIRCVIVDKQKVLRANKDIAKYLKETKLIHSITLLELLNSGNVKNAEIVMDNYPIAKSHLDDMKKLFKSISKFSFKDSKSDNLIQLADMTVGLIDSSLHKKNKDFSLLLKGLNLEKGSIIKIQGKLGKFARDFITRNYES